MAAATLFAAAAFSASAQSAISLPAQATGLPGQGQAVVTILPARGAEQTLNLSVQDVRTLKVGGHISQATGLTPLRSRPVELVLLIDAGARASLGTQMGEISRFVQELPPHTKTAIAYMEEGRAVFAEPFSSDPAVVLKSLHLPSGPPGASASPYFCLSDLAKHWPSQDASARREVVMVTDGVDNYDRRFDPEDPYVQAAIDDAVRARMIVYSIYWTNTGRFDRRMYGANAGQDLLYEVAQATGGNSYWMGTGNPVSFQPYFADINRRLDNQYELDFMTPAGSKPQIENLKLKLNAPAKVDAPQQVYVHAGE